MPPPPLVTLAVSSNRGPLYDTVLLAHVLAALASMAVVSIAGAQALVLRRSSDLSPAVRRYYRPAVNWGGRVLFLVPVLGATLVALSGGAWSYGDTWIVVGLVAWAAVALAGELVLWPAERRLQQLVATWPSPTSVGAQAAAQPPEAVSAPGALFDGPEVGLDEPEVALRQRRALCLRVAVTAGWMVVVLVAVAVVMVAKP
ncbi:MAG: hypothetical protein M0032_01745 [Actinomycetota bacterium]|nr:hypothetical protein [Actinomycetota bacterium]MDA8294241.1 hypothetical protein [Actinomycetota bacterium]